MRPLGLSQADYEELEFYRRAAEPALPLPRPAWWRSAFWFCAFSIAFLFILCLYGFLALAGKEDDL